MLTTALMLTGLVTSFGPEVQAASSISITEVAGWNETLYIQLSGVKDSNITTVSYNGSTSGSMSGDDFNYLVS